MSSNSDKRSCEDTLQDEAPTFKNDVVHIVPHTQERLHVTADADLITDKQDDMKTIDSSDNDITEGEQLNTKRSRELKQLLALSKEANLDTNISYKRKSIDAFKLKELTSMSPKSSSENEAFKKVKTSDKADKFPITAESELEGVTRDNSGVTVMQIPDKIKKEEPKIKDAGGTEERKNIKDIKTFKPNKDLFCWRCHREGVNICCETCPRSYHQKCLKQTISDINNWPCPECVSILKAESTQTRSPAMKGMTLEHLCSLLKFAVKRMIECNGSEPFLHPVNDKDFPEYKKYIIQPMNLTLLEKNIKENLYGSTQAFEADSKWILHNSIIFNSYQSKLTSSAKTIIKICKQEMSEIENCPSCYLNANTKKSTWFVEVCPKPHILVWAKLKGFPFWPAKAMCTNSSGMVDVRFFGAHDRAWVPSKECFLYSRRDPNSNKQKRNDIIECMREVEVYISNIKALYGEFNYAPFKLPYDPDNELKQLLLFIPRYKPNAPPPKRRGKSIVKKEEEAECETVSVPSFSKEVHKEPMEGYGTDEETNEFNSLAANERSDIQESLKASLNKDEDDDEESDESDSEDTSEEEDNIEAEVDDDTQVSSHSPILGGNVRTRGSTIDSPGKIKTESGRTSEDSKPRKRSSVDEIPAPIKISRRNSDQSVKSDSSRLSTLSDKINRVDIPENVELTLGKSQSETCITSCTGDKDTRKKPIQIEVENNELSISPPSKVKITDRLMQKLSSSDEDISSLSTDKEQADEKSQTDLLLEKYKNLVKEKNREFESVTTAASFSSSSVLLKIPTESRSNVEETKSCVASAITDKKCDLQFVSSKTDIGIDSSVSEKLIGETAISSSEYSDKPSGKKDTERDTDLIIIKKILLKSADDVETLCDKVEVTKTQKKSPNKDTTLKKGEVTKNLISPRDDLDCPVNKAEVRNTNGTESEEGGQPNFINDHLNDLQIKGVPNTTVQNENLDGDFDKTTMSSKDSNRSSLENESKSAAKSVECLKVVDIEKIEKKSNLFEITSSIKDKNTVLRNASMDPSSVPFVEAKCQLDPEQITTTHNFTSVKQYTVKSLEQRKKPEPQKNTSDTKQSTDSPTMKSITVKNQTESENPNNDLQGVPIDNFSTKSEELIVTRSTETNSQVRCYDSAKIRKRKRSEGIVSNIAGVGTSSNEFKKDVESSKREHENKPSTVQGSQIIEQTDSNSSDDHEVILDDTQIDETNIRNIIHSSLNNVEMSKRKDSADEHDRKRSPMKGMVEHEEDAENQVPITTKKHKTNNDEKEGGLKEANFKIVPIQSILGKDIRPKSPNRSLTASNSILMKKLSEPETPKSINRVSDELVCVEIKSEPESSDVEMEETEYMEKKRTYMSALNISERTEDTTAPKKNEIRTRSKTEEIGKGKSLDNLSKIIDEVATTYSAKHEKARRANDRRGGNAHSSNSQNDDRGNSLSQENGEIFVKSFAKLAQQQQQTQQQLQQQQQTQQQPARATPQRPQSKPKPNNFAIKSGQQAVRREMPLKPPNTEVATATLTRITTPTAHVSTTNVPVSVTASTSKSIEQQLGSSGNVLILTQPGVILPTSQPLTYNAGSFVTFVPSQQNMAVVQSPQVINAMMASNVHQGDNIQQARQPNLEVHRSQNYIPQNEDIIPDNAQTRSSIHQSTASSVANGSAQTPNMLSEVPSLIPINNGDSSGTSSAPSNSEPIEQRTDTADDEFGLLHSMVPESVSRAISEVLCRPPPRLKPRPPGPLSQVFDSGNPSSAGPVSAKINSISHRLGDYFRGMLIEMLEDLGKANTPEATISTLKHEIETLQHKHAVEMMDIRKNVCTILKDIQGSIAEERERIIDETRSACELEALRRIEEAKSKQWCANCGKEAQFYCCWNTSYCDYPCQQKHWSKHMSKCTQHAGQPQPSQSLATIRPQSQITFRPATPKGFTGRILAKPTKVYLNRSNNQKSVSTFKSTSGHLTLVDTSNLEFLTATSMPGTKFIAPTSLLTKVNTTNSTATSPSSGTVQQPIILNQKINNSMQVAKPSPSTNNNISNVISDEELESE